MTLSVWRYAHLALAIVSSLFVLILSVTGVILAIDAVGEKVPAYRAENFNSLSLAQVIPELKKVYPEITQISVDHNQFVSIEALDGDGNTVKAYIDPNNGAVLGKLKPKSQFVQWTTALHRSLFLKETGRIIVGVTSFLLLVITITGVILIAKRQQGIRHFFAKINRDFFAQYFHVLTGRIFLIPVFLIALTGTHLFMVRMEIIKDASVKVEHAQNIEDAPLKKPNEFAVFQESKLSEIEQVAFPFMEDDPEEFYVLKLRDRELSVSQINGAIVEESKYPYAAVLEKLSLDLHTGRTNMLWAIVLGLASLNILFFIYTGFVITFKRTRTKIRNKFKAEQAEIVILVGTENGSTLFFANQIHKQLLADGKSSFIAEMNQYRNYPKAKHLLVFTSTYGLGTAPTNALQFENLLGKIKQEQSIQFSVVGFGSKAYPDYCAYSKHIDVLLEQHESFSRFLDLQTVNDRSTEEFVKWAHHWSEQSLIALATASAVYNTKVAGLKKFKVVAKTAVSEDNATFKMVLKPASNVKFRSGDLLAIYPANDNRERFYSIGNSNGMIQLMVKLYAGGLGSEFLYQLEEQGILKARIMSNSGFHFPEDAAGVAMIANGTGIAPFLGMIMDNGKQVPVSLYAGFRYNNALTQQYQEFAATEIAAQRLNKFDIAFSREEESQYVMDLIRRDAAQFIDLLENNGVVMICGSLNMQKDVEQVLEELSLAKNDRPLTYYKDRNQILTDCY
ncbi:PepSY domain-containing protein [Pedobacter frigoris]|uniref:FAD-binding oxidoreductase n=1 Tax=Pedobacter frigoris TaxID=2571272 RepID=A0A4U1CCC7_9SPHI|nr:PepSY domain-containing protein [Pedobacter frigoris]TKC03628.1 FAD-binding oxidoreductase [Pedobacter frigoris]